MPPIRENQPETEANIEGSREERRGRDRRRENKRERISLLEPLDLGFLKANPSVYNN